MRSCIYSTILILITSTLSFSQQYVYIDSDENGGPQYEWVDISETGETLEVPGDDDYTGPFDIGFEFPFYGINYSEFYVGSNGMIGFSTAGMANIGNQNLPHPARPNNLIAWFWDDMDPANGEDGELYYQLFDDYCIIQFSNWDQYPNGPEQESITAQILLFEDGRIILQYQEVEDGIDLNSCTVGVENADGTNGTTYCFNDRNLAPYNGLAILFANIPPNLSVSGTVLDVVTAEPIPDVRILMNNHETFTDENGVYQYQEFYADFYSFVVAVNTHVPLQLDTLLEAGDHTISFALEPREPIEPLDDYFVDFEEGPGIFESRVEGPGTWDHGIVQEDPEQAHSGENVWQAGLLAGMPNNTTDTLTTISPIPINAVNVTLSYWHWYDILWGWDGYQVIVSPDFGITWELIFPEEGYDRDLILIEGPGFTGVHREWTQVHFNLGQYQGEDLLIGFFVDTDAAAVQRDGVAIDDVEITFRDTFTFEISPLQPNYFELVSTFLDPASFDPAAEVVFGGIPNLSIVYQDDGSIFIPDVANTIETIAVSEAYKIHVADEETVWTMDGLLIEEPTEIEYPVSGGQWNWIGYPFSEPYPIESILGEYGEQIAIMLSDDGRLWIPELINTMGMQQPGEGYYLFAQDDMVITYSNPDMARGAEYVDFVELTISDVNPRPTGQPYPVLLRFADEELRASVAEIAIYDNDLLVGRSEVSEELEWIPVICWGGSEEYGIPGFTSGNPITVNLLDKHGESIEAIIQPGYLHSNSFVADDKHSPHFGDGPFAAFTIQNSASIHTLPSQFEVGSLYPNPFNSTLTVPFILPEPNEIHFLLYNTLGQLQYDQIAKFPAGQHRFTFDTSGKMVSGVYFLKVQTGGESVVQKVILLR
ncbi:T9SS type A sorting domain-containing protein [bacterium]|nr:T9SS type A sorting domain-containing protein [bacterium]